jgi:hypothetical protein
MTAQEIQLRQQQEEAKRMQTASETTTTPPTPNQRVDTGQSLGVQMPDGSVKPVPEDRRSHFMIGGTGGRLLDRLPNTQYPVVEM